MALSIFISRLWRLKNIILPVLLLFMSFGILAEQRLEHGVLQAYWKAQWSDMLPLMFLPSDFAIIGLMTRVT